MKTLEQVISAYKSQTLDGRDLMRLAAFVPNDQLHLLGLEYLGETQGNIGRAVREVLPFTRENVLAQLKEDVAFAFEKALDRRGISSQFMFECVRMWNWVLEEGLEDWDSDNYAMYGLPLYKATALKYGFPDEIDGREGSEDCFGEW